MQKPERRGGYQKNAVNCRHFRVPIKVGTMFLKVYKNAGDTFPAELLQRYQRSEQAFILALMEMILKGVSTQKLTRVIEEICGMNFTASTVAGFCKNLDYSVMVWNERDLAESAFPFLVLSAANFKIREKNCVHSYIAPLAVGVNAEGYREILGIQLVGSEGANCWPGFFAWLKRRGLHGVDLIVSKEYEGLDKAVKTYFQGAVWQRCQINYAKSVLDACPGQLREELNGCLTDFLAAPDLKTAQNLLKNIQDKFAARAREAVDILTHGFWDAFAVLGLPRYYRERLCTTTSIEPLNREIRRRERVIRIFPSHAAAMRVAGTILMEHHERWSTGRHYFNMDEYWSWKSRQKAGSILAVKETDLGIA